MNLETNAKFLCELWNPEYQINGMSWRGEGVELWNPEYQIGERLVKGDYGIQNIK